VSCRPAPSDHVFVVLFVSPLWVRFEVRRPLLTGDLIADITPPTVHHIVRWCALPIQQGPAWPS